MTIHLIVMPITDENIEWASIHYPHYITPQFSEKRKKNYLLSRSLLSFALSHFFNLPKVPKIEYGVHGKPFFNNDIPISFNISHTDRSIALLIGDIAPLGVDIETIKTRRNFEGLEARTFSESERAWLHQTPNYINAFFFLWSMKEAYLKASGQGLSGLSSLSFDMATQKALGKLSQGNLYVTKLESESLSIFIPNHIENVQYHLFNQKLLPISIDWQIMLTANSDPLL